MEHFSSDISKNYQQNMVGQTFQNVREPIGQQVSNMALLELKPGERFQGEIAAVGGDEVVLKLANGQFLSARLEGDIQFAIGQLLAFQVQSNQNSKLVLKPVYIDQMQRKVGETALKAAGIATNEKTMQMVSAMLQHGVSIDKNTMQSVYRQILQNPQQNLKTILQLHKLQIPVNQANINQIESYQNMTYQIENSIESITKEITDLVQMCFERKVENTPSSNMPAMSENVNMEEKMVDESLQGKEGLQAVEFVKPEQGKAVQNETENISAPKDDKLSLQTVKDFLDIFVSGEDEVIQSKQQTDDANGMIEGKESLLVRQGQEQLTEESKPAWKQILTALEKETFSFQDFSKLITSGKLEQLSNEEVRALFSSKEWKQFFRRNLQKEWSIEPQEVAEKEKIDQLYRKIQKQVSEMSDLMQESMKNAEMKPKAVQNLQQNLQFMNQVNQIFQYVQLPLKWKEGQAHGDLYVYTNKKNFAQGDGTVTAFLHLDMEHLGCVDAHVSLELEKSRLQISFEMEKQEIPFMTEHLPELNHRLEKLGYKVKTSANVKEQGKSLVQMLEESKGTASTLVSYQKFDMRA